MNLLLKPPIIGKKPFSRRQASKCLVFFVSFGCGILLKEQLDQFNIGGAPLGFWMAQQGSIICFVILLIVYAYSMNKLDKEHGYEEEGE